MSDAADNYDKYQILNETNEGDYHATFNPCGWDADGLPENLRRFSKAVAEVGKEVRAGVATAVAAANQGGAWKRLVDEGGSFPAISRLADNQIAIAGDWTGLLVLNRSVKPGVTSTDSGWIAAVAYEVGNDRTVITETGWVVDAGISELWFGQDPENAPSNPVMNGATATAAGLKGTSPAPTAGQQNSVLCGDAIYHDAAVDAQIWR